jgi:hypothetical protein
MRGAGLEASLYRIEEVLETTVRPVAWEKADARESVIPSAKYCCPGSPLKSFKGSTASEVIASDVVALLGGSRRNALAAAKSMTKAATDTIATDTMLRHHGVPWAFDQVGPSV